MLRRASPSRRTTKATPPPIQDVRVGPLRTIVPLLRELGQDPDAVFLACGLDTTVFDDPERRVPFRAAAEVISRGAALCGREDFGLLIGQRFSLIDDFGLLGQLMWRASTIDQALQDLNRFLYMQDRGSVSYLRPAGEGMVTLGYSIFDADTQGAGLIYDLVMALALRLLQGLAGSRFRPIEVWLAHGAPRQLAPYRRVFGAALKFDAPRSEIHFAERWLQQPLAGADAMQHELVQRAIGAARAGVSPGIAASARAAARALLMKGDASATRIAAVLDLHERTLRRRLATEGESLQGIVTQARFEVARQLLSQTQLGMAEIAAALGYAEASAFVRAFRQWAGCTPGRWRSRTEAESATRRPTQR